MYVETGLAGVKMSVETCQGGANQVERNHDIFTDLTMDVQPFALFPYEPLKSDELRLLHVEPGDTDVIRVELRTVKIPHVAKILGLVLLLGCQRKPRHDPSE